MKIKHVIRFLFGLRFTIFRAICRNVREIRLILGRTRVVFVVTVAWRSGPAQLSQYWTIRAAEDSEKPAIAP